MFLETLRPEVSHRVLLKWWFMAFLAGQLNAGGFIATGKFVSHLTGFATLIGVEAGQGDYWKALSMVTVPLFFIAGVVISGMLVEAKIIRNQAPRSDLAMAIVVAAIFACTFCMSNYGTMALLCMASGLMNSLISSTSKGTVRVTHLTGATTDVGISFVRWWAARGTGKNMNFELVLSQFRLGLVISFVMGSAFATLVFVRERELGFLFPSACALYAFFEAHLAYKKQLKEIVQ